MGNYYDLDGDGEFEFIAVDQSPRIQQRNTRNLDNDKRDLVSRVTGFYLNFLNDTHYALQFSSRQNVIKVLENGSLILSADSFIAVGEVATNTIAYQKTESIFNFQIGDMVVDHKNQVLRKITNIVDSENQITIDNVRASLDDLFDDLYLSLSVSPDSLNNFQRNVNLRNILDLSFNEDFLVQDFCPGANGEINIKDDLSFNVYLLDDSDRLEINTETFTRSQVHFLLNFVDPLTINSTFTIPATASFSCLIGFLPIEIDLSLEGMLNFDVKEGIELESSFILDGKIGNILHYNNANSGDWTYYNRVDLDIDASNFSFNSQEDSLIEFSYKPLLDFKIGYVDGPTFGVSQKIKINSEVNLEIGCGVDFPSQDFFEFFDLPVIKSYENIYTN
jgi:hypothetical protein